MSLSNQNTPTQLQRLNHAHKGSVASVLLFTAIILGSIAALLGVKVTDQAPSDGPLPKTPTHQGQLAGGVRDHK